MEQSTMEQSTSSSHMPSTSMSSIGSNSHHLIIKYHLYIQSVKYMRICVTFVNDIKEYCMVLYNTRSNDESDNIAFKIDLNNFEMKHYNSIILEVFRKIFGMTNIDVILKYMYDLVSLPKYIPVSEMFSDIIFEPNFEVFKPILNVIMIDSRLESIPIENSLQIPSVPKKLPTVTLEFDENRRSLTITNTRKRGIGSLETTIDEPPTKHHMNIDTSQSQSEIPTSIGMDSMLLASCPENDPDNDPDNDPIKVYHGIHILDNEIDIYYQIYSTMDLTDYDSVEFLERYSIKEENNSLPNLCTTKAATDVLPVPHTTNTISNTKPVIKVSNPSLSNSLLAVPHAMNELTLPCTIPVITGVNRSLSSIPDGVQVRDMHSLPRTKPEISVSKPPITTNKPVITALKPLVPNTMYAVPRAINKRTFSSNKKVISKPSLNGKIPHIKKSKPPVCGTIPNKTVAKPSVSNVRYAVPRTMNKSTLSGSTPVVRLSKPAVYNKIPVINASNKLVKKTIPVITVYRPSVSNTIPVKTASNLSLTSTLYTRPRATDTKTLSSTTSVSSTMHAVPSGKYVTLQQNSQIVENTSRTQHMRANDLINDDNTTFECSMQTTLEELDKYPLTEILDTDLQITLSNTSVPYDTSPIDLTLDEQDTTSNTTSSDMEIIDLTINDEEDIEKNIFRDLINSFINVHECEELIRI